MSETNAFFKSLIKGIVLALLFMVISILVFAIVIKLAKLDTEYNASVHESVDVDDYDLPDDFIEESVCDSEINEIAALLDTI